MHPAKATAPRGLQVYATILGTPTNTTDRAAGDVGSRRGPFFLSPDGMSRKTPRQQPMAAEPAGAPYRDGTPIQWKDYQHHRSIYGVVPAKTGHLRPAGQWNDEEIMCRGRHVTVTLNG